MANYTTTITNEGAALLASVIANQGTLTFNEFRFSENDYTGQESTLTEGTFLGVFITAGAAASVIDLTTIKASAQFNNSTITGNHDLYSIGIIGTDGNTTALIAVCTTTDPDVIREPLTGTSTYAFNVNLSVSDTSQITVAGTTAAVIYDIDVVDNLISPATNKPLSANQGRVLNEKVESLTNPNLIDNPWFTVNQRGATTVTSGFGADRWQFVEGTSATYSPNGVSLDNSFICQILENQLPNGLYTASVKYQDGTIEHGTAIKADNSTAITFFTSSTGFKLMYIPLAKRFDVNGKNGATTSIRAIKLEVGSVSTLHLDVAPDYATELLKCQRYFYRIKFSQSGDPLAVGHSLSDKVYISMLFPVEMRSNPTMTYAGSFSFCEGTTFHTATNIQEIASTQRCQLALETSGTLNNGLACIVVNSDANAYIDFSADL